MEPPSRDTTAPRTQPCAELPIATPDVLHESHSRAQSVPFRPADHGEEGIQEAAPGAALQEPVKGAKRKLWTEAPWYDDEPIDFFVPEEWLLEWEDQAVWQSLHAPKRHSHALLVKLAQFESLVQAGHPNEEKEKVATVQHNYSADAACNEQRIAEAKASFYSLQSK